MGFQRDPSLHSRSSSCIEMEISSIPGGIAGGIPADSAHPSSRKWEFPASFCREMGIPSFFPAGRCFCCREVCRSHPSLALSIRMVEKRREYREFPVALFLSFRVWVMLMPFSTTRRCKNPGNSHFSPFFGIEAAHPWTRNESGCWDNGNRKRSGGFCWCSWSLVASWVVLSMALVSLRDHGMGWDGKELESSRSNPQEHRP